MLFVFVYFLEKNLSYNDFLCMFVSEKDTNTGISMREKNCALTQGESASYNRIEFIDLAKGICIILVVCLHLIITVDIPKINILRMPLYFLLSGLFFKDYGCFSGFIIRKINKMLIPFIFFYLLSCLYYNFIYRPIAPFETFPMGVFDPFLNKYFYNIALWFLLALFWSNILFFFIYRLCPKEWIRGIVVLFIGLLGHFLYLNSINLPLFIAPAFTSLPFFYAGYLIKKTPILYKNILGKWNIPVALLIYASTLLLPDIEIDLRINMVEGNIFLFYIEALLLVISLLLICKTINKLPVLSYLGRYSIIVLCTHIYLRDPFFLVLGILGGVQREIVQAITLIAIVLLMYKVIPFCLKYLPYVTAQKNVIRIPA